MSSIEDGVRVKLSPTGEGLLVIGPSGHEVNVKSLEKLGALLQSMLLAQQKLPSGQGWSLGTAAAPLQDMVDDFLRRGGEVKRIGQIAKPSAAAIAGVSLEDLGLA